MQKNEKRNTILVPTDFSQVADNALDHAINVAKMFGNNLCIMHIFEDSLIGSVWGQKNSYRDGMVGQMLQEKLDRIVADITKEHGIKAKAVIKSGKIYTTITEFAEDEANDIESIIMGTNGASGFKSLVGSNASRVMSHAVVPVVVVKEKQYGNGYNNIVMPIDLTLESKQKVSWAIHLAKKYDSVIHVISIEESDEFLKNRTTANLKQIESVLEKNGVKFTTKILGDKNYPGNFADDTLQYADEINADLIMIMTQQEKEIAEYIMGTYAQKIVNNHSSVPVMCISPKKTGFKSELWHGF